MSNGKGRKSMTPDELGAKRARNRWRPFLWGVPTALLLLPLVAMRAGAPGVVWTAADFVVMGVLLYGSAGLFELAARAGGGAAYRLGAGAGIVTGFLLVWINLAVGIIGSEDNPVNLIYAGVLAIALIGSLAARFRARAMSKAMALTGAAQLAVTIAALLAGWGRWEPPGAAGILVLNAGFAGLWALSALLFRKAAGEEEAAAASPRPAG